MCSEDGRQSANIVHITENLSNNTAGIASPHAHVKKTIKSHDPAKQQHVYNLKLIRGTMTKTDFIFGTVGSPISTPRKPGGSAGAIAHSADLGLDTLELGWAVLFFMIGCAA